MPQRLCQMIASSVYYMLRGMAESGIIVEPGLSTDEKRFFRYRGKRYVITVKEVKPKRGARK